VVPTARDLLAQLVSINSVNPSLDPTAPGEQAAAAFIADFCREQGLQSSFQAVEGDRRNVLAWVDGQDSVDRLLFVAHLDTVPAHDWSDDPFIPRMSGSRLYARGAADTKASLAAMLIALCSVRKDKPRATIMVAGSVDEEHRKKGSRALSTLTPRFSAAVVGEPTSLELVVAHKGSVRWSIEAVGRAAHSSTPELGDNAIVQMAHVVTALARHGEDLRKNTHPLVGAPSLTVSLIEGGSDICTVPARCQITIDRRLVPGESASEAIMNIERILTELRKMGQVRQVRSSSVPVEDPPVGGILDGRLSEIAQSACKRHAGTGDPKGVPYGTDGSQLHAAGIGCIVLGPGSIEQAHTADEYVDTLQLEPAVEIYREIMLSY
jgi:acetylornithine deacetylase